MEKLERQTEQETYQWIPFRFLDQILKAICKCLGLLHQDSQTTTKPTSSSVPLNQPEEEEEEEEDVFMEKEVVVTSRGMTNGVIVSSRAVKVKAKKKDKEKYSSGRRGQHN